MDDRYEASGWTRGHYFQQDLHVAQRIFLNQPANHVDVGSRVDGFVAHVASFRAIKVLDIRPMAATFRNVEFVQGDLMARLPSHLVDCCDSLSCLHTIEHFGLGRYGDPINYDGYRVGLDNLHRIVRSRGKFYLSTLIGPQRVEFNAHRVFAVRTLLDLLRGRFVVDDFSYIDDAGRLNVNVPMSDEAVRCDFGCQEGCGIFEMSKI